MRPRVGRVNLFGYADLWIGTKFPQNPRNNLVIAARTVLSTQHVTQIQSSKGENNGWLHQV